MRKLSRRSTIFMVALGVLLTASIAFAAVLSVSGSTDISVQVGDHDPQLDPLEVSITQENPDAVITPDRSSRAKFLISVHNPNEETVVLNDPAVELSFEAQGDCTIDDLQINPPQQLDGEELSGGETAGPFRFAIWLTDEQAAEDCDEAELTITVTVNGSTVDELTEDSAEVSGSSKV